MNRQILWLGLTACLLAPAASRADSIWQRHNFFSSFLYVDNRARRTGDIVTVVIVENTGIGNSDQRNLKKSSDTGGGLGLKGDITGTNQGAVRTAKSDLTVDVNSSRAFNGSSAYNINQTFADTMTCTVVGVQPNGNLMIEGFRQRTVTREARTLRVSGVIRPLDIAFDNTIPSTFVGNLQIQYLGRGVETNFTNQGPFSRFFNYVWPF
jgi:flagellar L-ring protein precursor FlgH